MARLIWTEPALEDLGQLADYIDLDDPATAKRLVRKVFAKVELLQNFPEIGPISHDLPDSRYRHLVVRPLRIFYRIQDDTAFIVYVVRTERQLKASDLEEHDPATPVTHIAPITNFSSFPLSTPQYLLGHVNRRCPVRLHRIYALATQKNLVKSRNSSQSSQTK